MRTILLFCCGFLVVAIIKKEKDPPKYLPLSAWLVNQYSDGFNILTLLETSIYFRFGLVMEMLRPQSSQWQPDSAHMYMYTDIG